MLPPAQPFSVGASLSSSLNRAKSSYTGPPNPPPSHLALVSSQRLPDGSRSTQGETSAGHTEPEKTALHTLGSFSRSFG